MSPTLLPTAIDAAAFEALHDDLPSWRGLLESLASALSSEPVVQMSEGTVLVALVGRSHVLKVYPPFLRDHFEFERAALALLGGRLPVPTPVLQMTGQRQGWCWLWMTRLHGDPLTAAWPGLSAVQQCALLSAVGALAAQVHALPVAGLARQAPAWPDFVASQRARCRERQQRMGLPPHLLAQLDDFLQGEVPQGPDVILSGEYTPMNLLAQGQRLVGMFDFGDGLVGPREYDWLGPLAFLAAGSAQRCQAFFAGYGVVPDAAQRLALMRLLLLHRYSNLPAQIACPGWQQAQSFEALTALVWP